MMTKMLSTIARAVKSILPREEVRVPILRGPFRGGAFFGSLRGSLRKALGLYEHELNAWLSRVLGEVDLVIDVGANDGYFTFGSAAALRRCKTKGKVIAIEANAHEVALLHRGKANVDDQEVAIEVVHAFAGGTASPTMVTLDDLKASPGRGALIKIDVEGAELDVLQGAGKWLRPENHFLVEVHSEALFQQVCCFLAKAGILVSHVKQAPLPFIGREYRENANSWVVTEVGNRGRIRPTG